jgi:iron complex outermembrane receptor protein
LKKFVLFCTTAMLPSAVLAQSTGTTTFENAIVVTGSRAPAQVGGVSVPDGAKARGELNQDFISRQSAGQSIDDIINYLPGVSFQNNGPYGDAGGTLTIHGFDSSRISQTFDGVPTNDSGNYALYSQEQIDPELIERVNVSFGSTDIDSPTASATGGTVNYVTRDPYKQFHARIEDSVGDWAFRRVFGVIDTGIFTPFGTRAFLSGSHQYDVNPYDSASKLKTTRLTGKIFQPMGNAGDFVSLTGFYSVHRGNHFADYTLTQSGFPAAADARFAAKMVPCQTTTPRPGLADTANACGQSAGYYGYGQNPSNQLRLHANSRFTLAPGLQLTIDPNYDYTEANGGSPVVATENTFNLKYTQNGVSVTKPIYGYIGGKPYFGGVDLNGDSDIKDTVLVDAPSNTITHRYGVITNLIWHISPSQTVRVNYTLDHARLRQTGEVGYIGPDGRPLAAFPKDNPIKDVTGLPIEKRNRLSLSILNQVSGQYRGLFLDDRLMVEAGVRMPFFKRDLNNYCVAESGGSGFVDCFNDPTQQATFLLAHPTYQLPQSRNLKYNKALPSAGLTYNLTPATSLFYDYSEGLQVPSTDALYDSFAFPVGDPSASPKAEMTFNHEGGFRYKAHKIQAQLSGWYSTFTNRIEESTIEDAENPGSFLKVYTNLGTVHKYGIDANVAYAPIRQLTLYAFGSYIHSKILNDLQNGVCTANNVKFHDPAGTGPCTTVGQPILALTGGKQESGSPDYLLGGRAQGNFGPLEVGIQAKHTGRRYVNDQNLPVFNGATQVYAARTPAYTLVDFDARLNLGFLGLNDRTWFQVNVHNVFDKFYVGGFSGQVSNSSSPAQFVYVGTPRTFSATLNVDF